MIFHDWTLESIDVRWVEKNVVIHLRGPNNSEKIIECNVFSSVMVPREENWGPSKSINGIAQERIEGSGLRQLRIEMQSGDIILIKAQHVKLP